MKTHLIDFMHLSLFASAMGYRSFLWKRLWMMLRVTVHETVGFEITLNNLYFVHSAT
jgi:hypothetical protein